MAVRVRLTRVGSKKNPVWRVVVADQRSPRDGRIIEQIGHYDPHPEPSTIVIDRERLDHWLARGAEPTNTVRKLMRAPLTPAKGAAVDPAPQAEADPEADAAGSEAEASAPDASAEATPAAEPEPDAPQAAAEAPGDASEDAPVEAADSADSP